MRKLVVGVLAHVDAGKTTLSEALLYCGGCLRKLGRVDHGDAFLDTDAMERERGITIFSKQARLPLPEVEVTLLDTPGHVDFSAEMERTLRVLDCAILVISGSDGIQGHTRTLWTLLERYQIPALLVINKMDLDGTDRAAVMRQLKERCSGGCVDFGAPAAERLEEIALCDEALLDRVLEGADVGEEDVRRLVGERRLFPCFFVSALKLQGVEDVLRALPRCTPIPVYGERFGARVYQIARDPQGTRLTYLKVTGGRLRVKDLLTGRRLPGGEPWSEKADQIRLYSGAKFQTAEEVPAGTICAVTGLSATYPGEGLGFEADQAAPLLEPVLTYQVELPEGCDPHTALQKFRQLEEEDPQLHVVWKESLREIHVQLMGEVQLEILQRLVRDRFGLEVAFGEGGIVYRETLSAPVVGAGHFEPLRHYAEVHLLMEPGAQGSGVRLVTACPEDQLDRNWQRLILTHLAEREHPGVLAGAPLTDVTITLLNGRAHVKHTDGGDFRQATYRAIRQGLMQALTQGACVLLEPWYEFRLELPGEQVGRAISDLQRMGAQMEPPEHLEGEALLVGAVPVSELRGYAREVAAYTRGQGRLSCTLRGYFPCHNQEEVLEGCGYDPERDAENPADSVFCSHGSGVLVRWDEAERQMHVSSGWTPEGEEAPETAPSRTNPAPQDYRGAMAQEQELQEIFERTYGPVKERRFYQERTPQRPPQPASDGGEKRKIRPKPQGKEYLLVDGYNIIFAWDELKAVAREHLDAARKQLCDLLSNYQGMKRCEVIVVFDAYKVKGNPGSVEKYHNLSVVYTKEAETADTYIERATYEIGREHRVRVATSDGPEQLIILGHGALRVSASAFHAEMEAVLEQIQGVLTDNNRTERAGAIRAALERAQDGGKGRNR